ncbi:hypothetical protein WMY93_024711 [Mugilogobius chulae]|uniref:Uncharacterized protein n=1 Tax=Mugilogobius chulae TaxID=88201 RepID=A0AAW0N0G4_9GOBI
MNEPSRNHTEAKSIRTNREKRHFTYVTVKSLDQDQSQSQDQDRGQGQSQDQSRDQDQDRGESGWKTPIGCVHVMTS